MINQIKASFSSQFYSSKKPRWISPGPWLRTPFYPVEGHLASDFTFSLLPCDGPGGPDPGWVNPQTWLSFQGSPVGPGIRPAVGSGSEMWGISPCPSPCEFCGGMACCDPQVWVGLVPQGSLETSQPKGEAGAGVESNSGGASPEPSTAPAWCRVAGEGEAEAKPWGVPGHQSSAERTQAICQAPEAEEGHPGIYPGWCGVHPGASLWEGV